MGPTAEALETAALELYGGIEASGEQVCCAARGIRIHSFLCNNEFLKTMKDPAETEILWQKAMQQEERSYKGSARSVTHEGSSGR